MKRIILFTALLFTVIAGKAQFNEGAKFKLGLTAHPTLGWIRSDIDGIKNDGVRLGFSYGLLGDFMFADNYAFSTGLMLTTINGQTESNIGAVNKKSIYKLQYLEIPLKIKLLTNDVNGIRYYGEFGLGNGFNVRAKQSVRSNVESEAGNRDIYSETLFYRGSIIVGGGAEISTSGKTRIYTGITFDNGFTDIKKGSGTLKSSNIGLNFGVFF